MTTDPTTPEAEEPTGPGARGLWTPLNGKGLAPGRVGGKGAALDRLVGLGLPVPRAAALPVEAYRRFVEQAGLRSKLEELPAEVPPEELEADAARVRSWFLEAPMDETLREAIAAALDHALGEGRGAVRSSATTEDAEGASYAGQYETILDVSPDQADEAVRRCWASLWAPAVRAYRAASGDAAEPAMAVVVQRMVPAEVSGVAFTQDPTGAFPDAMRIEHVDGLGEALVSGEATPEVVHVRRGEAVPLDAEPPPFLRELLELLERIEGELGSPQDVEWSVAGGRVHILQSRPITTTMRPAMPEGDGFDTPPQPGRAFTPVAVGEMLPGPVPPLTWTTCAPMLESAFDRLFTDLGIEPPDRGRMLGRFRGRAALNLTRLKEATRRMPGGSGPEVERQYLGRALSSEPEEDGSGGALERLRSIRPAIRALRLRRRLLGDADALLETADLLLGLHPDLTERSMSELCDYRSRIHEIARFGFGTQAGIAAAAAAAYRGLEMTLGRWLPADEASTWTQRLTSGSLGATVTGCAAVMGVWEGYGLLEEHPEGLRAIHDGPTERTEERLEALGDVGRRFLDATREAMRNAGSTSVYGGRTWDEQDRTAFWEMLRQCQGSVPLERMPATRADELTSVVEERLAELEPGLRRTWRWRLVRIFTGQIVDARWRLLSRMAKDTSVFLRLRESTKSAVLRLGGEERRVVREIVRRLADEGALDPGDEWLLSDEELDRLARTGHGPDGETLRRRREGWEQLRESDPLPEVFTGAPPPPGHERVEEDGALQGWGASPGTVEGRVRLVRELSEGRTLERGEILLARSTDPSWTPLFMTAGGIVMEQGGPLSHAAIVSREFERPAVLNIPGVTDRLRTGTRVRVDGTRGTVEILEEA